MTAEIPYVIANPVPEEYGVSTNLHTNLQNEEKCTVLNAISR
jgi:hypothetical protein